MVPSSFELSSEIELLFGCNKNVLYVNTITMIFYVIHLTINHPGVEV